MKVLKNNWQFLAIIIPVLIVLYSEAKGWGASENRITATEVKLAKHIEDNKVDYEKFTASLNSLTANVVRLNTYLEIYFEKKGIKIDEKIKRQ